MKIKKYVALTLATLGVAFATVSSSPASASPLPDAPKMAVIGDSFTAGFNGTTRNQSDAWWNYTANDLGWRVGNVVADPGGGYWTWGDYGTIYQALAAHPIAADTNVVLLQAGLNDSNSDAAHVVQSVSDVRGLIRQQAPNAVIIVVGMFVPGQQGMTAARLNIARRIGDYEAIGNDRYMIAAMCSFEVSGDGTHPTNLGHRQIGDWVAWHIANGLDNGKPLHQTDAGYYTV